MLMQAYSRKLFTDVINNIVGAPGRDVFKFKDVLKFRDVFNPLIS